VKIYPSLILGIVCFFGDGLLCMNKADVNRQNLLAPQGKILEIKFGEPEDCDKSLLSTIISEVCNHYPELKELKIITLCSNTKAYSFDGVNFSNLEGLENLHLELNTIIRPEGMEGMVKGCKKLKKFYFKSFLTVGILELECINWELFSGLCELHVISDQITGLLSDNIGKVLGKKLKKFTFGGIENSLLIKIFLEKIDWRNFSMLEELTIIRFKITKKGVEKIGRNCLDLKCLGFISIIKGCCKVWSRIDWQKFKKLKEIFIKDKHLYCKESGGKVSSRLDEREKNSFDDFGCAKILKLPKGVKVCINGEEGL